MLVEKEDIYYFHDAIQHGNVQSVLELIKEGADIEAIDPDAEFTPLMTSVAWGQSEVTSLLLEHGAQINARGRGGDTALHVLMLHADDCWNDGKWSNVIENVRTLVLAGADTQALNDNGNTPAEEMANRGFEEGMDLPKAFASAIAERSKNQLLEGLDTQFIPALQQEIPNPRRRAM